MPWWRNAPGSWRKSPSLNCIWNLPKCARVQRRGGGAENHRRPVRLGAEAVFTLLDDDRWYVIANFRETDLNNVRPGVAARITVMTNHNRTFNGVVDSVGSGVLPEGGSVIEGLPLIQKSINWVHVSQRFPVKIAVSDPDPELFRMGASASAVLQP